MSNEKPSADEREYTEDNFRREGLWNNGGQIERRALSRRVPRFTHFSVRGEFVRVLSSDHPPKE